MGEQSPKITEQKPPKQQRQQHQACIHSISRNFRPYQNNVIARINPLRTQFIDSNDDNKSTHTGPGTFCWFVCVCFSLHSGKRYIGISFRIFLRSCCFRCFGCSNPSSYLRFRFPFISLYLSLFIAPSPASPCAIYFRKASSSCLVFIHILGCVLVFTILFHSKGSHTHTLYF